MLHEIIEIVKIMSMTLKLLIQSWKIPAPRITPTEVAIMTAIEVNLFLSCYSVNSWDIMSEQSETKQVNPYKATLT
jgi:hypothetical protein